MEILHPQIDQLTTLTILKGLFRFGSLYAMLLFSFCLFSRIQYLGLAGYADFKSSPRGHEPQSYNLEWTSESQSDIMEFELMWREEGGSWEGFTVPSYRLSSYNWSGKYAFTNLNPATRYEARVAAENSLGWSRPSPTFHFATFGAGKYTCQHMDGLQNTVWKI